MLFNSSYRLSQRARESKGMLWQVGYWAVSLLQCCQAPYSCLAAPVCLPSLYPAFVLHVLLRPNTTGTSRRSLCPWPCSWSPFWARC